MVVCRCGIGLRSAGERLASRSKAGQFHSGGAHGLAVAHYLAANHGVTNVAVLEQKLQAAQVNFEFHRYEAKHAFANEEADSKGLAMIKYDADAAALAWSRTESFFAKHLR